MPTVIVKLTARRFAVFVVCSLVIIFCLPYLFPVQPSLSPSYIFGYSNRVGVLLLLAAVTTGVVWTRGLGWRLPIGPSAPRMSRWVLLISLITAGGCSLAMYLFAGRYGAVGEAGYLVDRCELLAHGSVPYSGFEFAYGPAMLYVPILLSRLFSLDVVHAYYVFWGINHIVGTALLFYVVDSIESPARSRLPIYLCSFIPSFLSITSMGTNYTALRFIFPIYCVLLVRRTARSSWLARRKYPLLALVCTALAGLLVLISPELAIAFAFACVCMLVLDTRQSYGMRLTTMSVLVLGVCLVFGCATRLHVLDTLISDSGGVDSFPIIPAPHLLVFFVAAFFCGCLVYERIAKRRFEGDLLAIVAYSVPMLAAALGRCDAGHVLWNGQGIFLVTMFYLAGREPFDRVFRKSYLMFSFALPAILGSIIGYIGAWHKVSHLNTMGEDAYRASYGVNLERLYPDWHGLFMTPFDYRRNGVSSFQSERITQGFYASFVNGGTPAAIQARVNELASRPTAALLLPEDFDRWCQVDISGERTMVGLLFAVPYFGRAVHTESVRLPICQFIHANYHLISPPTSENYRYGLWVRN